MSAITFGSAPDGHITSRFWTVSASSSQAGSYGARNLFELFVQDVAGLVSGASQASQAAHSLYPCLPADEICLREAVLGLSEASRSCLPHLPSILLSEGLILPPTHDTAVCVLLATIQPEACANLFEPWSVIGTRTLGVLRNVALYLKTQALEAAEIAGLLGSVVLQDAFDRWAEVWKGYLNVLQSRELGFRAQAYAAGMINNRPHWQHA